MPDMCHHDDDEPSKSSSDPHFTLTSLSKHWYGKYFSYINYYGMYWLCLFGTVLLVILSCAQYFIQQILIEHLPELNTYADLDEQTM